ncbi:hypothetical protein [Halodesulfovibrio sp.]|uniref:DUF4875 domain-containing protein n=1 Tax=Halodesulfovibrio sp. TaxID=1912772 RepID=UPI0025C27983|nr:hypothetical protein [Halodesulfovibrio sp.]
MMKNHILLSFILAGVILGFTATAHGYTKPNMSKAVPYTVEELNHGIFFDRGTVYMEIFVPNHLQSTPEQYAHTVIKAAWETLNKLSEQYPEEDLQVITVIAFASPHGVLADAVFAKDKMGSHGNKFEWLVNTIAGKMPPAEYYRVDNLWWELEEDYMIPDPEYKDCYIVDTDTLVPIIAKKLNIPLKMVHFPYAKFREYYKK